MSSQSLNRQGISAVFQAQRQTQETGSPCLGLRCQLVSHGTARMCKDKSESGLALRNSSPCRGEKQTYK